MLPARSSTVGVARPEQVAGMTGLQMFEAMLAGELPRAPITETLDFMLVEAALGRAVFQGRPPPRHYNPLGSVHGGWFATLLDSAVGLRRAHDVAGRQGLHDGRAEDQHRAPADRQGAAGARGRQPSSTSAAGWRLRRAA